MNDSKNGITPFDYIFKMFLSGISNDYRIKDLFVQDEELANDMLKTWLSKAVSYFKDCHQDLENNFDYENNVFNLDLTLTEQVILADLMILVWMEWNINNIVQMNLSLQDSDFNRHAETQNLAGKSEYANRWREQVYHEISEYDRKSTDLFSWATGEGF